MKLFSITLLLIIFTSSCTKSEDNATPEVPLGNLISPGVGVGKFEIGSVSLNDIAGSDSSGSLTKLNELGLGFHSDQGKLITEIIVSRDTFSTKEGIRVGTSAEEVRELLGPPLSETVKEKNKGFEFPILIYEGIGFFMEEGEVSYIVVR